MQKITVIIPAYNSGNTILQTINAIKNQENLNEPPEIIVVNDGSTDNTLQVLEKTENIITISQKNSGPATARNTGAKIAKGDILIFTDSDTIPHKDWLYNLSKPFQNQNIAAATGTYSIENKESKLAQLIQEEIGYKHSKYNDYVAFGGTYNLAIKKEVFDTIGGFNEGYKNASGEDVDICYKILKQGYQIRFVKDAIVGHFHPENLYKYLKNQFNHGFWRAKLYYDHPNKLTGDDYTGNKEIIETLSAGFTIISPILYLFSLLFLKKSPCLPSKHLPLTKGVFLFPIISLLFIEYTFVSKLYSNRNKSHNLPSRLYAAFVFSLRTISRTLGFIKGLIYFSKTL